MKDLACVAPKDDTVETLLDDINKLIDEITIAFNKIEHVTCEPRPVCTEISDPSGSNILETYLRNIRGRLTDRRNEMEGLAAKLYDRLGDVKIA